MDRRRFLIGGGMLAAPGLRGAVEGARLEEAATILERAAGSGALRSATLEVRQGAFAFQKAFGKAGSPDAVFLIASITKPMTATGLMVLSDRGELTLEDPVQRFIPEFSEGDRRLITIRHLLTHTSGLPDQLPENVELRRRLAPLEEFVERAIRTPLLFQPGSEVRYQSMGLLLASEVAQRITGERFPAFLAKEVFGPLEMKRTALGLGRFKIAETELSQVDEAPGLYGRGGSDTKSWDWNSPYWRNLAAPWGGAHSTGPDIAKFLDSFLNPDGRVVKESTARAMVVNQTGLDEPWGIGWAMKPGRFGESCSENTFGHSGSTGTLAWADRKTGLTCVVLTTLPARASGKTLLRPVSDVVSTAAS